jgi:hypothetical protein
MYWALFIMAVIIGFARARSKRIAKEGAKVVGMAVGTADSANDNAIEAVARLAEHVKDPN